ncbi:alpha/beta hydrolase family protein [Pseudoxanthomonas composti]|uniref:Alpha/beta fold hydrolase n=1 Tax=Pseudoxanthomonas composti TaxID=2137479 RepID=A0A4Q1JRS7_9GAMM|nr:alpha/beta hydrolase [Pseudoxanthomonas composti]RXR00897.1 alpha/beta fold hydrolase [Pseudoxanthomonas composti]
MKTDATSTPFPTQVPVQSGDGHTWTMLIRAPAQPRAALLWIPALGVAARHYLPFAQALAERGIAVCLHEWRGHGSSSLRAGTQQDWGYRELLTQDLPATESALAEAFGDLPRLIGGHSLGGQLACCHAALSPQARWQQLWLVASGTPYWRCFPGPRGWLLPLVYRFLPWLARRHGALPGRRIGFGGNEARGVIQDWARVGLSDVYAAAGVPTDLQAALSQLDVPTRGVLFARDWLAPPSSLRALTARFAKPANSGPITLLDRDTLKVPADHFAWMQAPAPVAEALLER